MANSSGGASQERTRGADGTVAGSMAVPIVDALQPVDVGPHDRDDLAAGIVRAVPRSNDEPVVPQPVGISVPGVIGCGS